MKGSILAVVLLTFAAVDGFQISSSNPDDVAKYFCQGDAAPIGQDAVIDVACPETDVTYIGDHEVVGCKLEAGSKMPISVSVVSPVDAFTIKQQATTKLGKATVGLPGLKKLACDSATTPCIARGARYDHAVTANIPPLVPFALKGKLATFTLADQDSRNLVCINIPVFIPAGAIKSLRKKY